MDEEVGKTENNDTVDMFTTLQEHELKVKELRSVFVDPPKEMDPQSRTTKEKIQAGLQGVKNNSKRFVNFVKSKIRRKEKETIVQDVKIVQEDDETWARRSVGSAASRSSIDSKLSSGSDNNVKNTDILSDCENEEVEE
ncbi:uncharacterized protein LOC133202121 [Saccostrea echinata]|uniref:uncharacterized protein LOC133202121 n=1 Tax=Saccostrea echinata TaxID=191078 RepID=UPI002A7F811A|nr:uncharacterized protein LOC133202121 [Saccostrea echinata]